MAIHVPTKTRVAQTTTGAVSVDTSSTAIVGENAQRKSITLQNDHATRIIYLALSEDGNAPTAVVNSGIRLLPAAANKVKLDHYTGPIAGISNTGGAAVCLVTEL